MVYVKPNASQTKILGLHEAENQQWLKIALHSPPVDGKANDALIRFLSETLGVTRKQIELTYGKTSKMKRVLIRDLNKEAVIKLHNLQHES